jgi:hypothetical protein
MAFEGPLAFGLEGVLFTAGAKGAHNQAAVMGF